jgi:hypothetical protein
MPRSVLRRLLAGAVLVGAALAPGASLASDGVIEINQARLAAGGVTTGDTPGAPVTLSTPGSYRLTSDLRSGTRATSVILITSERVTLDLNGFSVGPCLGVTFPAICFPGTEPAIGVDQDYIDLTVRNGSVIGSGGDGLYLRLSPGSVVEGVRARGNANSGMEIGPGSLVRNVVSEDNLYGFFVAAGTLIEASVIRGNELSAIGQQLGPNGSAGYRGCVITENGTPAAEAQPINANVKSLGNNLCGSDSVCP